MKVNTSNLKFILDSLFKTDPDKTWLWLPVDYIVNMLFKYNDNQEVEGVDKLFKFFFFKCFRRPIDINYMYVCTCLYFNLNRRYHSCLVSSVDRVLSFHAKGRRFDATRWCHIFNYSQIINRWAKNIRTIIVFLKSELEERVTCFIH